MFPFYIVPLLMAGTSTTVEPEKIPEPKKRKLSVDCLPLLPNHHAPHFVTPQEREAQILIVRTQEKRWEEYERLDRIERERKAAAIQAKKDSEKAERIERVSRVGPIPNNKKAARRLREKQNGGWK